MPSNKQRREAARRKLERQLQAREERARRRRRGNLIASIVGALVVVAVVITFIAVSSNNSSSNDAAAGSSSSAAATAAGTTAATAAVKPYPCVFAKSGTAARPNTPPTNLTPPKTGTVNVAVTTTRGPLAFELTRATGPCAVESFTSLISQKYYNNSPCHRLVTTGIYVLQCGDPTGKGTGGPGYTVNDEYTGKETYGPGVIAMANTGAADSTGGQFFIIYKDSTAGLEKKYTVVGKVTSGMDVVQAVAAGGVAADGTAPKLPITINTMATK